MSKENEVDRPDDKTFLITVNGRQRRVERDELSFDNLVESRFRRSGQGAADRVHDHVPGGWRQNSRRRARRRASAEGAGWNDS